MATRQRREKPKEPFKVDTEWFKSRAKAVGLNNTKLAQLIGRDKAMITKIFSGERVPNAPDVAKISSWFRVPADEVLHRLGLDVTPHGVAISGRVLGDGRVSPVSAKVGGRVTITATPADAEAVVAETEGTALAAFNGAAFVFVRASHPNSVPPDAFGRLCFIEAEGQTMPVLATMARAKERGSVVLEVFQTGEKITATNILRASVVLHIVFA